MKKQFEEYLISHDYRCKTPGGHPSTVYDYVKRIDRVCQWEQLSWQELSQQISDILPQYDKNGSKEEIGRKSHSAVINALRRFSEFVAAQ